MILERLVMVVEDKNMYMQTRVAEYLQELSSVGKQVNARELGEMLVEWEYQWGMSKVQEGAK